MTLVLASASPRRHELLAYLQPRFEVSVSNFDEAAVTERDPAGLVRQLAASKALAVAPQFPNARVLGADTIVVHEGDVLGKPADAEDARCMLRRLRDREHLVFTGVALAIPKTEEPLVAHRVTRVQMRPFSDAEIERWIESGGPFDKAGSYAVQAPDFHPVQSWHGCYCNVMGLPIWTVAGLLHMNAVDTDRLPDRCRECPDRVSGTAS